MARDLFNRYVWIVDTIRRHGRITRSELNRLWRESALSDGNDIPRRTFFTYRQDIERVFNITIGVDQTTYEYYIDSESEAANDVATWVLNSAAVNDALTSSRDIAHRIGLEDVPSARQHLTTFIDAIRQHCRVEFDYHPYTRSTPTHGITIEPYFLKIFRQRWYVIGYVPADRKVKTYALDRMTRAVVTAHEFDMPDDMTPASYFADLFGIESSEGQVRTVKLKVPPRDAKYMRALPLHPSQEEMVADGFSIFSCRMKITDDLVRHLLSLGNGVTVLEPAELRAMMVDRLQSALDNYK